MSETGNDVTVQFPTTFGPMRRTIDINVDDIEILSELLGTAAELATKDGLPSLAASFHRLKDKYFKVENV